MVAPQVEDSVQTLHIYREADIDAPLEITWQAVLAELGPECRMPAGEPMPFQLELWPGGRWFRDLGNGAGHLWGHVQVIKPPALLELCGPMFMSYPATNHLQYRLSATATGTRLAFTHRAMGQIPPDIPQGASRGWEFGLEQIRKIAARLKSEQSMV